MFTRIVSMTLKPNASTEFTKMFEQKIVPMLRKEPGFQDVMVFVVPGGPELVAISIWDSKEDAESYARSAYPQVLRTLEHLLDARPEAESYQLAYSTLHRTGVSEFPKQSPNTTPAPGVGG
jgi:heme-degrading monooxygenase HmoA